MKFAIVYEILDYLKSKKDAFCPKIKPITAPKIVKTYELLLGSRIASK